MNNRLYCMIAIGSALIQSPIAKVGPDSIARVKEIADNVILAAGEDPEADVSFEVKIIGGGGGMP